MSMTGPHCRGQFQTPDYDKCRFCGSSLDLTVWATCPKAPQVEGPLPAPGQVWDIVEYGVVHRMLITSVDTLGDFHVGKTGSGKRFYTTTPHSNSKDVDLNWPPGQLVRNVDKDAYPWGPYKKPSKAGLLLEDDHAEVV